LLISLGNRTIELQSSYDALQKLQRDDPMKQAEFSHEKISCSDELS